VNVRSEARDCLSGFNRSTYGHREPLPARESSPCEKIITEEMQLRFSSMQVDIFALLTEARQRLASLPRRESTRSKNFFLAQSDLQTAVKRRRHAPRPAATIPAPSPRQRLPTAGH